MRTNAKAFITICLLLISFTGLSQTERRYDAWEHPILKRLDRHDPYLITFTHNDSGDYFIPLAILNKANARLYYISTLGFVFDSVSLGPVLSKELAGKRLDAFGIYTTDITAKCLNELEGIRSQIRAGKFDVNKLLARNSYLTYTELKNAISSFEQLNWLVNLENEVWQAYHMVNLDLNRRNDSVYIAKEQGFQFFDPCKIKIHGQGKVDSVEFTPCNRFTRLSGAVLKPDKRTIYLFDQQNRMFDSFLVKKNKIKDITENKEDVFALYQLWLEWQLEKLTKEWNKIIPQKPARFDESLLSEGKLRRLDTLSRAAWVVEQKMRYATIPDKDLVLVSIAEDFKTTPRKKWMKAEKRWSDLILEADPSAGITTTFRRGQKEYFLTDHRGNVVATVSDRKIQVDSNHDGKVDYYVADVITTTDYAPFGAQLPGRTYRNKGQQLKYGYNGKENDNEVKGEGNQQDYGFRIYDPRLGRFLSVDPISKEFPWNSTYAYAENDVIRSIDLDGLEKVAISGSVPGNQLKMENPPPGYERTAYTRTHIKNFAKQAERLGQYGFTVTSVMTGKELLKKLEDETSAHKEITHLAVFTHAFSKGLLFKNDEGFYISGHKKENKEGDANMDNLVEKIEEGKIKFAKGAIVFLDGCDLGYAESFAEDFVMRTGVSTIASAGKCVWTDETKANGEFSCKGGFFKFTREKNTDPNEKSSVTINWTDDEGNNVSRTIEYMKPYKIKTEFLGNTVKVDDYVAEKEKK